MKVVVDTMGSKMVFPDVQLTKLESIGQVMDSRAQTILLGSTEKEKTVNYDYGNYLTQIMARVAGTFE